MRHYNLHKAAPDLWISEKLLKSNEVFNEPNHVSTETRLRVPVLPFVHLLWWCLIITAADSKTSSQIVLPPLQENLA